jgi:hypothetical protein
MNKSHTNDNDTIHYDNHESDDISNDISNDLVVKFNYVIMSMITHIIDYYSDSNTEKMKFVLEQIIKKMPEEPISYFLIHVYENDVYRRNILEQNDSFFIGENFEKYTKNNKDKVSKLFEFKDLWKKIDNGTKQLIKKSMVALVKISQKYILAITNNKLNKSG